MEEIPWLYGLVVRFELRDGHEDAFDALTSETLASIRLAEPGTLAYVVHRDALDARLRVFYELYRDEAAFEAHEQAPHIRRFLAERKGHLAREPEVWRVAPTVGVVRPEADPGGG